MFYIILNHFATVAKYTVMSYACAHVQTAVNDIIWPQISLLCSHNARCICVYTYYVRFSASIIGSPLCVCVCVCMCVCVCVYVFVFVHCFLPPRRGRSQNIGTNGFTATQKNIFNRSFFAKNTSFGSHIVIFLPRMPQITLKPQKTDTKEISGRLERR